MVRIVPLGEHPEFIAPLARAHHAEWKHLYTVGPEVLEGLLREECAASEPFPATFVAVDDQSILYGSVSLVFQDFLQQGTPCPWLSTLVVFPEFRKQGIGRLLVGHAIRHLAALGHHELFLYTEDAAAFFARLDFTQVGETTITGTRADLMKVVCRNP